MRRVPGLPIRQPSGLSLHLPAACAAGEVGREGPRSVDRRDPAIPSGARIAQAGHESGKGLCDRGRRVDEHGSAELDAEDPRGAVRADAHRAVDQRPGRPAADHPQPLPACAIHVAGAGQSKGGTRQARICGAGCGGSSRVVRRVAGTGDLLHRPGRGRRDSRTAQTAGGADERPGMRRPAGLAAGCGQSLRRQAA